jgi:uncharacterized protein YqgV (UPF0045/DUF77 family)
MRQGTTVQVDGNLHSWCEPSIEPAKRTDCDRIAAAVKIDYRAGPGGRMNAKVAAVEQKVSRKLTT